jgi:hypothetical protein
VDQLHATGAPEWAIALEASALAFALRDSTWIYPLANLSHILGLALLVGPIIVLDLRLVGLTSVGRATDLSRLLTPVAVVGLCLSVASGLLLFTADATAIAVNLVFQVKACLIVAAIANALLFRALWHRRLATWEGGAPVLARGQALASVLLWLAIPICGRLIAYF